MSKKRKKLKKKNPIAKLLSSPMLRNKVVKNKKKFYNRKKYKLEND
jgi:stalled ribosome alternative rescue factor ArfA